MSKEEKKKKMHFVEYVLRVNIYNVYILNPMKTNELLNNTEFF